MKKRWKRAIVYSLITLVVMGGFTLVCGMTLNSVINLMMIFLFMMVAVFVSLGIEIKHKGKMNNEKED